MKESDTNGWVLEKKKCFKIFRPKLSKILVLLELRNYTEVFLAVQELLSPAVYLL